jgi:hypothetical protein
MKTYMAIEKGNDQYLVIRLNNKLPQGHKNRYKEYLVDLKNSGMLCNCEHWYYTHFWVEKEGKKLWQPCSHFKFVTEQLKMGNKGIIHKDQPGLIDELFREGI